MIYFYKTRMLEYFIIKGTRSVNADYAKQTIEWFYNGYKYAFYWTKEELDLDEIGKP